MRGPVGLTVAVTDAAFEIESGHPVLEILLLPDQALAVSSATRGVHTLRPAPLAEILDSFAGWVGEWLRSDPTDRLQAVAFLRDKQGTGVAGAVLAPRGARLQQRDADTWEPVAIRGSLTPRDLLDDLIRQMEPTPTL